jgi:hypothetical protein
MKHRRISTSPLIDPAISALIIMAPMSEAPLASDPATPPRRAQAAVAQAATVMNVPVFLLLRPGLNGTTSRTSHKPGKRFPRSYLFEEHACPWADKAFVDALEQEDRSILLFAGSWFEHEVLGTALHGLAEGYDACVLLDATAARSSLAAQPAQERLTQAGGTPVVTSQVLHEWMVQATTSTQRTALRGLLAAVLPRA